MDPLSRFDQKYVFDPLTIYTEYGVSSSVLARSPELSNALRHASSDVVSRSSENHVNQMARMTELELDVKSMDIDAVSIRRDPKKSKMWCDSTRGAIAQ